MSLMVMNGLLAKGIVSSGPDPLAKLLGQWDADHVTVSGGNSVTLLDQSGNGNDLPALTGGSWTAAPPPSVVSGKNVIADSSQTSSFAAVFPLMPADDNQTLVSIARPDFTADGGIVLHTYNNLASKGLGLAPVHGGGNFARYINDFSWESSNLAGDTSTRHLYMLTRIGGLLRLYRNGAPLLPVWGTAPNAGADRIAVLGAHHLFKGDWRLSQIFSGLTRDEITALTQIFAASEGTADASPPAIYDADDDFEIGSTIDTTGGRRTGATAWTARNIGSVTNAIASGTLSLTLPQESTVIFRGYTQPTAGSGAGVVEIYRVKIIPANLGTVNGHHAGIWMEETAQARATTFEVGYDSTSGSRQIRTRSFFTGTPWSNAAWMTVYTGGFSSSDWSQEWTLWMAFDNRTPMYMWYQIGSGPLVLFNAIGWFDIQKPTLVGIGVTAENGSGGTVVGDFTDFAREY